MTLRSTGSGVPILWIHGLGESSLCFERFVTQPDFDEYQHWLIDLPGYGRSQWAEPLKLAKLAQALDPVLRRLNKPVVVGHSMGGVLAIMLAEMCRSDLLRAVVNIEGNVSPEDCQYSGQVVSWSLREFMKTGHGLLLEGLYQQGQDDAAHRGYFVSMRLAQPEMVYRHSQDLVEISETEGLVGRMESLKTPLLYLAGTPNGVSAHSLKLLDQSGLKVRRIDGSGHWPFIDQPEKCARVLSRWFGELRLS